MEDIFEQSIPDACKTLTSQLKSKQLPVEAICPVLQKALNQHISTVDSVLSSHILAFLSELQASKAPPVLGRELLQAVIAVQGGIQGKRHFQQSRSLCISVSIGKNCLQYCSSRSPC